MTHKFRLAWLALDDSADYLITIVTSMYCRASLRIRKQNERGNYMSQVADAVNANRRPTTEGRIYLPREVFDLSDMSSLKETHNCQSWFGTIHSKMYF